VGTTSLSTALAQAHSMATAKHGTTSSKDDQIIQVHKLTFVLQIKMLTLNRTANGPDNLQSQRLSVEAAPLRTKSNVDHDHNALVQHFIRRYIHKQHFIDKFSNTQHRWCRYSYADNITFRRWTIANGDDGISLKANTTNVLIENSTFHDGAVALGSIGQYVGQFETIENIIIRDIRDLGRHYPAYAKTWTGKQKGIPPNGGGGGVGCTFRLCHPFSCV
jgi:hypothetical protein